MKVKMICMLSVVWFLLAGCSNNENTSVIQSVMGQPPSPEIAQSSPSATPLPATEQPVKVLKLDYEKMYPQRDIRAFAQKMINTKATDFTLSNMKGSKVSLSDFKGQNVVLEFAQAGCSACMDTEPEVMKYKKDHPEQVILQTFSLNNSDQVKEFMKQTSGVADDHVLTGDLPNSVVDDYQADMTPTFYFIDTKGFINLVYVGAIDENTLEKLTELAFG